MIILIVEIAEDVDTWVYLIDTRKILGVRSEDYKYKDQIDEAMSSKDKSLSGCTVFMSHGDMPKSICVKPPQFVEHMIEFSY